jgi:GMP synthase (glutamine-hydrolysing)
LRKRLRKLGKLLGDEKVICAVSGGVDSTVLALLLMRAIGENLIAIFIDNGLMREGEGEEVLKNFREIGVNIHYVNASEVFLERLKGIVDPEEKRRIIGRTFIEIFEREAKKIR